MVEESRVRATTLLKEKHEELVLLAKALVDYETLNREEAFKVVRGEKLDKQVVPNVPIKVPEGPSLGGPGDVVETLPPIPGSQPAGEKGRPPPQGGAMA